jgi:hypothetical protein
MPHFMLTFGDASRPPIGVIIIVGRDHVAMAQ